MLKQPQTPASTIVSVSPLSPILPTNERQHGMVAGEAALCHILAESEQRKGAPLTGREIREYYGTAFQESRSAWERGEISDEWVIGWWHGLAAVCSQAERATPEEFHQRLYTQGKTPFPSIFVSVPELSSEEVAHYQARGRADFHAYIASVQLREGRPLTSDELSDCRSHLYWTGIERLKRLGIPTAWWQCWAGGVLDGYSDVLPKKEKKPRRERRVTGSPDGCVLSSRKDGGVE